MLPITRGLRRTSGLSISQRRFLLVFVPIGSSIPYTPAYLRNIFYDPLKKAIDTSDAGVGELLSYYTITATICYFPSGITADKVKVRTLAWVGSTSTVILAYLYTMLPSFAVLRLVFAGMGMMTILIQWGIRFKLVRPISEEDTYPRNIGIPYGLYGAAGLAVGPSSMGIIESIVSVFDGSSALGIQVLLLFPGTLILILGILSSLYIPESEGGVSPTKKSFNVRLIREALRNPIVWVPTVYLSCVYFPCTDLNYTTPYFTAFPAPRILTDTISILRTYGIVLASGPVFDLLAKAVGSLSKVIFGGSLVCAGGMFVLMILPAESIMIILVTIFTILLGFITNDALGIVSSQLTEGKVPISIFGMMAGVLSIIGFLPDSFFSAWFGEMIDDQDKRTYTEIFLILTDFAVVGAAFAVVLLWYVKRRRKMERVGPTPSEPTPAPSYEETTKPIAAAKSTFDSKKDLGKGLA